MQQKQLQIPSLEELRGSGPETGELDRQEMLLSEITSELEILNYRFLR